MAKRPAAADADGNDPKQARTGPQRKYKPEWKTKYPWICGSIARPNNPEEGMYCALCVKHGRAWKGTDGAFILRGIDNWKKALELLARHEGTDLHRASVDAERNSEAIMKSAGTVFDALVASHDKQREDNRCVMKRIEVPLLSDKTQARTSYAAPAAP